MIPRNILLILFYILPFLAFSHSLDRRSVYGGLALFSSSTHQSGEDSLDMDTVLDLVDSDRDLIPGADSNSNAPDLIRRFSPRHGADFDNEVRNNAASEVQKSGSTNKWVFLCSLFPQFLT